MKKKLLALMMATLMFALTACGGGSTSDNGGGESTPAGDTYELALITDVGTIDDKSFNQGSWEGLAQYANEKNITHKYYQPAEKTTDAYLASIELATLVYFSRFCKKCCTNRKTRVRRIRHLSCIQRLLHKLFCINFCHYAISNAIFIICVNEFCLSSAEDASPVNGLSEIVQMHSAFLPARSAFI